MFEVWRKGKREIFQEEYLSYMLPDISNNVISIKTKYKNRYNWRLIIPQYKSTIKKENNSYYIRTKDKTVLTVISYLNSLFAKYLYEYGHIYNITGTEEE